MDDPLAKKVAVTFIEGGFPYVVWKGAEYDAIGDWTQAQLVEAISDAITKDPLAFFSAIRGNNGGMPFPFRVQPPGCSSCGGKPPIAQMAVNYGKALAKEGVAILSGVPDLTPDQVAARLAICNAPCVNLLPDKSCVLCGCPVAEKAKFRSEICDAGKWKGHISTKKQINVM